MNDPNDGWHSDQPWTDDQPAQGIVLECWRAGSSRVMSDLAAFIEAVAAQAGSDA
jgi:hypothetical protein